jgi:hypothetical protein
MLDETLEFMNDWSEKKGLTFEVARQNYDCF